MGAAALFHLSSIFSFVSRYLHQWHAWLCVERKGIERCRNTLFAEEKRGLVIFIFISPPTSLKFVNFLYDPYEMHVDSLGGPRTFCMGLWAPPTKHV